MDRRELCLDIEHMIEAGITPDEYLFLCLVRDKDAILAARIFPRLYRLDSQRIALLCEKKLLVDGNAPGERYFTRYEPGPAFLSRPVSRAENLARSMAKLYPRTAGSRRLICDIPEMTGLLSSFLREHPSDHDRVLPATALYVEREACNEGGRYILSPAYFIYQKGKGSTLAAYCRLVEEGDAAIGEWSQSDI